MYLILKKIEHPVTRDDYRYNDGRKVFEDSTIKADGKGRPLARTQAELQALYCDRPDIEIVRRYSLRFELRVARRKNRKIEIERLWTGKIKLNDGAAVEWFWSELEWRTAKEESAKRELIRQKAQSLVPRRVAMVVASTR